MVIVVLTMTFLIYVRLCLINANLYATVLRHYYYYYYY